MIFGATYGEVGLVAFIFALVYVGTLIPQAERIFTRLLRSKRDGR